MLFIVSLSLCLLFYMILFPGNFYDGETVDECVRACSNIDIIFGYPSIYEAKNGSTSFVTMYFKTSVSVQESIPAFPASSLFAEIGGYTGLLLGFSFFDITRILRYCSERILKVGRLMAHGR